MRSAAAPHRRRAEPAAGFRSRGETVRTERTFRRDNFADAYTALLRSRFEKLLHKAYREADRQGVMLGCVQLLFPAEQPQPDGAAFFTIDMIPGWLSERMSEVFVENLAKSLGDWARFRDPAQTDICGDRSGPAKHVCGLERDHPGDHQQHHSSGGCAGWPRR